MSSIVYMYKPIIVSRNCLGRSGVTNKEIFEIRLDALGITPCAVMDLSGSAL